MVGDRDLDGLKELGEVREVLENDPRSGSGVIVSATGAPRIFTRPLLPFTSDVKSTVKINKVKAVNDSIGLGLMSFVGETRVGAVD